MPTEEAAFPAGEIIIFLLTSMAGSAQEKFSFPLHPFTELDFQAQLLSEKVFGGYHRLQVFILLLPLPLPHLPVGLFLLNLFFVP